MSKQISTKTTIRNLTAEIKKTFVKKDAFTPVQTAANAAIKSLGVDGNTVNFYTSTDKSGTAAFSVDFPSELFLDQTKTTFVAKFKFDAATYPGATDPKLDGWWIPTRLRPSARMLPPPLPSLAMRWMSRSMFPLLRATL